MDSSQFSDVAAACVCVCVCVCVFVRACILFISNFAARQSFVFVEDGHRVGLRLPNFTKTLGERLARVSLRQLYMESNMLDKAREHHAVRKNSREVWARVMGHHIAQPIGSTTLYRLNQEIWLS